MPHLSRNLILVATLLAAASVGDHYAMAWSRSLAPLQGVNTKAFPYAFAEWKGVDYQTEIMESAREFFGTDNFIDRVYSAPGQYPVELVLLPTASGLHSPSVCARFGGLQIIESHPAKSSDPNDSDRIVLRTQSRTNSDYACSYYWRTPGGVAHEAKAYLPPTHYTDSIMVSLCTPVQGDTAEGRFRALDGFRATVDPEVLRLIQHR